jgi:hypothetical protein
MDSASDNVVYPDLTFIRDSPDLKISKPYRIVGPMLPKNENLRTNIESEVHKGVAVHDARPRKQDFSLDIEGFEFIDFESNMQVIQEDEASVRLYLEMIADLLKKHFNTHHVYPYDLRVGNPA